MQLVINLRKAVRPFVNTRQPLIQLGFQLRKVVRPFVNSCQPLIQLVINLRKVFFHVFDAIGAFLQGIAHIVVFCGERRHHKIIFSVFGIVSLTVFSSMAIMPLFISENLLSEFCPFPLTFFALSRILLMEDDSSIETRSTLFGTSRIVEPFLFIFTIS